MSEYPNPAPIIVGYTVSKLPNWQENLQQPDVPKSYTKQDTIDKWLSNYWEAVGDAAAFCKMTGRLDSIFAVDPLAKRVFDSSADESASVEVAFVKWLTQLYDFGSYARAGGQRPVCIYGFNPKPLLRLAGLGAIRHGAENIPVGLWYMNEECLDPKEMLLETEMKKVVPLEKILAEAPGGAIDCPSGYTPHVSAAVDAILAAEICGRYQLIDSDMFQLLESLDLQINAPELAPVEESDLAQPDDEKEAPAADSDDSEYDDDEPELEGVVAMPRAEAKAAVKRKKKSTSKK